MLRLARCAFARAIAPANSTPLGTASGWAAQATHTTLPGIFGMHETPKAGLALPQLSSYLGSSIGWDRDRTGDPWLGGSTIICPIPTCAFIPSSALSTFNGARCQNAAF